jgi:hypothetical protein
MHVCVKASTEWTQLHRLNGARTRNDHEFMSCISQWSEDLVITCCWSDPAAEYENFSNKK